MSGEGSLGWTAGALPPSPLRLACRRQLGAFISENAPSADADSSPASLSPPTGSVKASVPLALFSGNSAGRSTRPNLGERSGMPSGINRQ